MKVYLSPEDQQRPGQRIVNYARMKAKVQYNGRPDPLENWLWNLSEQEFKKVMDWSPEHD